MRAVSVYDDAVIWPISEDFDFHLAQLSRLVGAHVSAENRVYASRGPWCHVCLRTGWVDAYVFGRLIDAYGS